MRLAVKTERSNPAAYQLSHERLIPTIRKVAGRLLDDATRANELLERRVRAWIENERSPRYLLNVAELLQVNRQRPYLLWGENRDQKEALLRYSSARLQRRLSLAAVACSIWVLAYVAWCSNAVQRSYLHWKLRHLANTYQSEDIARALAAMGDLQLAEAVVVKTRFSHDEDEWHALGSIVEEACITALANGDQALLKKAQALAKKIDDPDESSRALARIASEMGKAHELKQAKELADTLDKERPEAIGNIAAELAKAGKFDDAVALAKTLDAEDSEPLARICVELANAGGISQAQVVASMTGDSRAENLAAIAVALSKQGQFRAATNIAATVGEFSSNTFRSIAVEMTKRAYLKSDTNLLSDARGFAAKLDWTGNSLQLWQIAKLTGDREKAAGLLGNAAGEIAMERQQGSAAPTELMDIPRTMVLLAVELKDWELVQQARAEARTLDPSFVSRVWRKWCRKLPVCGDHVGRDKLSKNLQRNVSEFTSRATPWRY